MTFKKGLTCGSVFWGEQERAHTQNPGMCQPPVNSSLGFCGRCRLDGGCLRSAEGVKIRPDVLHSFVVKSLHRRIAALRGKDLYLHLTAIRIHGVWRIYIHPFVSGIVHLYQPVLDRYGYGNPARMDWLHFLVSTKQLHSLEISLELEFCGRIEAE